MKKYLIKSSAFTLALAMVLGLASCKDDVQVETATDVAVIAETATDVATTTVGTEQTTIVSSTSAQEEITLVTATEPTTAEKAVETAKTTQNTTKKTNAKATTTKATVKSTQKATTKATTKKTTTTTKAQDLTDEDVLWAQQKANEYIQTLPKAKLDPNVRGFSMSRSTRFTSSKENLLQEMKDYIDFEYDDIINNNGWNGVGMYIKISKENNSYYWYVMYDLRFE